MSKRRLVVSLAVGLALAAAGWWAAKSFWLMPPPAYSTQMIAYGVAHQIAGRPAIIALRLGVLANTLGPDQIKGPVPVSMLVAPYTPLAKKNKLKGDLLALLDVDASGSVAGVREMTFHYDSSEGARLANNNNSVLTGFGNSVLQTAHSWKFKPATEKGEPVPATVIVQVRF